MASYGGKCGWSFLASSSETDFVMIVINFVDGQENLALVGASRNRLLNLLRFSGRIEPESSLGNNHGILLKHELVGLNGQLDLLDLFGKHLFPIPLGREQTPVPLKLLQVFLGGVILGSGGEQQANRQGYQSIGSHGNLLKRKRCGIRWKRPRGLIFFSLLFCLPPWSCLVCQRRHSWAQRKGISVLQQRSFLTFMVTLS